MRFRWDRLASLIAVTLAILYVFSRFVPASSTQDYAVNDGIDNAWTMALHEGFVEHLQFGTDLVFTYGPWGFLAHGYHPLTHLLSQIVWAGLTLAFLSGGWQLAWSLGRNRFLAWAWLVILAALATTPLGNDFDNRLVLFVTLPLLLHFFTERTAPAKAALIVSLGCLSLVKFTGLVESAFVVTLISVDQIFYWRRFPWAAPLWAASLLCFWLLAWQKIGGFGAFLLNSWQIAAGYTEAMMSPGNAAWWSLCGFVAIAIALLLVAGWAMRLHRKRWAMLPLAGVAMIPFVAFKLGYVRCDIHQINSAMALLILTALLLPLTWRESGILKALAVGLLVLAGLFSATVFENWLKGNGLAAQLAGTVRLSNLLAPLADASTGYSKVEYEKQMAGTVAKTPLPPLTGGADFYSYDQGILFAHRLPYQPRPIIQSYSAYTPALAEMNAAWLRSDRAASNILFVVQPLDRHFPSLEDGASWPELLTRYDVNAAANPGLPYLVLQRSATPRSYRLVPLTNAEVAFGENIQVPSVSNALIWVELDIKKTSAGKLISAAYKPPMLMLATTFKNGTPGYYRLIPGMAQTGFLLSPVINDTKAFASLYEPAWLPALSRWEVQTLAITPSTESRTSICYTPSYSVRFYRLEISK
ncbi:MAG TPA: hypothetical protein VG347_23685 [Verrucomicrobiae bacterium]|nr:hypothetical protein [Verrucomicrobiae bacterium]